jgi:hypothetical protein
MGRALFFSAAYNTAIMTRRILLFCAAFTVFSLALALIGLALWDVPTSITKENGDRIRVGMTLAEVEAILGGPARDEVAAIGGTAKWIPFVRPMQAADEWQRWVAPNAAILVGIKDGRVVRCVVDQPDFVEMPPVWRRLLARVSRP